MILNGGVAPSGKVATHHRPIHRSGGRQRNSRMTSDPTGVEERLTVARNAKHRLCLKQMDTRLRTETAADIVYR